MDVTVARRSNVRGFTLIELMITLVVLAIVVVAALPNLRDLLQRNRLVAQSNEMVAALSYARTEAIRAGRLAGVCSSSDGAACGGTWQDGWIVWVDTDRSGGLNDAAEILRVAVPGGDVEITGSAAVISFDSRGLAQAGGGSAFAMQPSDCEAGEAGKARSLVVNAVGQARVGQEACT